MHTLARICVQRPVFATVLSLTLVVVGLVAYSGLGVDRLPKIDFPRVSVSVSLPGASPQEIESDVTDKIERRVNTVSGIEILTSTSSDGQCVVSMQFELSKDVDVAAEEVRAKVALARRQLPPDVLEPVVSKFDIGSTPVVSFAVSSPGSIRDTYEYVDKVVRRRLESVSGVGEVQVYGGRERQINVVVDPYRLRAYDLSPADISDALEAQNAQVPGGLIEQGKRELSLRTRGRVPKVEQLADLAVKNLGSRQVFLRDVAEVEDGEARATTIASVNGRPTVLVNVVKQSDANTIDVIAASKQRVAQLSASLPAGYRIDVVRDQSTYIERSLNAVREHLILGSLLAVIVVFLFLANWRSTIIAALAIPTSIIATFGLMKGFDFTQNMVTLLALTLSVGIVIDDAIVVLENVFRVMEEEGLGPIDATIRATKEIGLAVLAITISLVVVFLPVSFMSGIMGRFMYSFGITMAGAIAVSMLVSFSTTPMLCSRWLRLEPRQAEGHGHGGGGSKGGWFGRVEHAYGRLLHFSLRIWPVVLIVAGLTLASSWPLYDWANKNYQPDDDESQFQIVVRTPEGTSLEGTRPVIESIADDVRKLLPEVKLCVCTAGDDGQKTANLGTVYVRMNEVEDRRDRRVTQYTNMDLARKRIIPKWKSKVLTISVQKTTSSGGGQTAAVQVAVKGPDLDKLVSFAQQAVTRAKRIPGVADADSTLVAGKPELSVFIDRARASTLGVKVEEVAQALRLAVAGDDKISAYDEGGEQYEIHLRLDRKYRGDAQSLALLTVPSEFDGRKSTVTLDQVVKFVEGPAPSRIDRLNRQRQFTLRVNIVKGVSQQTVTDEVEKILKDLNMGPAYTWEKMGQAREMVRTFRNFAMAAALSFVFMYLVVSAQFESFVHALVIMFTLPLTFPFALLSIIATGDSLNSYSMLGILVLLGVVKKNAILQVDRANQLREEGMGLVEAAVQASKDRLRPILMTTLAFVAGMLPLVLSRGTGSATSRTCSSVIVGGQVLSLLLTLVAAPVLYVVLDGVAGSAFCRRVRAIVFRKGGGTETPEE